MKLSVAAATLFQLISIASIPVDAQKGIRRRAKAAKGCKHEKAQVSFFDTDDVVGTATVRRNEDCSVLLSMDLSSYPDQTGGKACLFESGSCPTDTCDENNSVELITTIGDDNDFLSRAAGRFTAFDDVAIEDISITLESGPQCKAFEIVEDDKSLEAGISTYPGYEGSLSPGGTVKVVFNGDDSFKFSFNLNGLEAGCMGCGIHIHSGTSCDSHDLVLGHYWDDDVVADLWTSAGGAFYSSDDSMKAKGSFNLYTGYGYEENKNHAVVVHAQTGLRIGCGILE
eukprot:CAMPEP_0116141724 /NCGR_PEP_ID=MMETSP0329-20121206/14530_1 /TAXON_ID=697910 /ORGANISM="Pseudo-nitzschia arenysensis, Strain B593" /LENGTH=283 /DNA_ID=CAMNT_0003636917 /DNA_START=52 /DNA_END=903 /DNA_ORIENTATION=+